jgi:hypothetical protein
MISSYSLLATALAVIASRTTPAVAYSFVSDQLIGDHIVKRTLEEGDGRESKGYMELGLSIWFFVVLLGGCKIYRHLNQLLTQGNNQSNTDNGATSPSAPTQNETRNTRAKAT